MIQLTAKRMKRTTPLIHKVGLIATDGTINSRLYENIFSSHEIIMILPEKNEQSEVMDGIYRHIKKGDLNNGRIIIHKVTEKLIDRGAEALICGCTEISLVLKEGELTVPIIDPLQVLAEEAVLFAQVD
jgi:aspartate racemase